MHYFDLLYVLVSLEFYVIIFKFGQWDCNYKLNYPFQKIKV